MTNAEWCIKNGYKFSDLDADYINQGNGCRITINGEKIGIIPLVNRDRAIFLWLDQEHVEPILDEVEKRYLAGVIRPFRGEVKFISKNCCGKGFERIEAKCCSAKGGVTSYSYLPVFKAGTMYKGMELNRKYTLEELGL